MISGLAGRAPTFDILSTIRSGVDQHRAALLLFAILQIADVVSTFVSFRVGMWEANPVAAWALAKAGEASTYGLKLTLVSAVLVIVCLLQQRYAQVWRAIHLTNFTMLLVVISNILQIGLSI